jgi:hypothetical protein
LRTILENDTRVWDKIFGNKQKSLYQQINLKGEIYSGNLYKTRETRQFIFSGVDFSMAVATDDSKLEIWPIFCAIHELDFTDKSRHVMSGSL